MQKIDKLLFFSKIETMSLDRSRYRPQSYSYRRNSRRRSGKNYKPLFLFLLTILVIGWLGIKVVHFFAGNDLSQSAEAVLEIKDGTAEFALGNTEKELWTRADSGQTLLQGDKLKTSGNGIVEIRILGNAIFVKPETELEFTKLISKEDGQKNIEISLKKGEIWTKVVGDDFADDKSSFVVSAKNSTTYVHGTIFDVKTSETEDIIRLIRGKVDVDVHEFGGEGVKNVVIGAGQKLVVNDETYEKAVNGDIVLEPNDKEFIQSEWNLKNLEQFDPQETAKIRGEIEKSAEKIKSTSENELVDPEIEPPVILSPQNEEHIPASEDLVIISGTVPENIFQVVVNGYTLTKFEPGDRKWSYVASKKFGTLVPGENKYTVKAVRRDGKESKPAEVVVFYDGFAKPKVEDISRNFRSIDERKLDEFKAPDILKPIRRNGEDAYQTSSEVVMISGIVDPKTNRVEVNGFQLRKFKPGDTEFVYIANAKYGNMKKGENVYEVVAYGPDGKKASSSIKIIYTPLEL